MGLMQVLFLIWLPPPQDWLQSLKLLQPLQVGTKTRPAWAGFMTVEEGRAKNLSIYILKAIL
jgi:hypothetical protein